uniref:ribosomal protein S19 n=1 Tax=Sarcophyte sanguinea TaxID=1618143 RepID=UPI0026E3A725|nr:ribosomal protein S19 [Sarcophyte sanguinea]WJE89097.1 ribosomal protein S19 [Sarcophyte sanguinea]WJE89116.1 ribosomal protein S19 [Sarcophyte sanguinea]
MKIFLKKKFISTNLLKKIYKLNKKKKKKVIKTWSRSSIILPIMVGHIISIYNGKEHLPIHITNHMIGHKLGEFSFILNLYNNIKNDKKSYR